MNQWGKYSGHYKSPLIDIIKIHPIPLHLLSVNIGRDSSSSLLKLNQSSVNGKRKLGYLVIYQYSCCCCCKLYSVKNLRVWLRFNYCVIYTDNRTPHPILCHSKYVSCGRLEAGSTKIMET